MHDPRELAGQILGRMDRNDPYFQELLKDCNEWIQFARIDGKLQAASPVRSSLQYSGSLMRIFQHGSAALECIYLKMATIYLPVLVI